MIAYCNDCGGVATPNPEAASDCTCEYASCGECGSPYATAAQCHARACASCEDADPRTEWQRRPTVEVPVLITIEACNAEALRRVGGAR